jgi:alkaline phosphatase D
VCKRNRIGVALALLASTLPVGDLAAQTPRPASDSVAYGVAVGEVTATTAIVWGRCNHAGILAVRAQPEGGREESRARVAVTRKRDFTGRVQLDRLRPNTAYVYEAVCEDFQSNAVGGARPGRFHTAPREGIPQPVRFAWGGDLGGQNVCRDLAQGYVIFDRIRETRPEFFIALGDMMYADSPCKPTGLYGNEQVPGLLRAATRLEDFWAAWRYNRADRTFDRFLAEVPIFAVWDDHEIMNDAGPHHDTLRGTPGPRLLPIARQAFLDYQPLLPPVRAPAQLYRRRQWGRHLEIFLLDTRQYRDANSEPDRPDRPKSMLGKEQRDWLVDAVGRSKATWKVIISSVPIAIPTGDDARGRDGWASFGSPTGSERELRGILKELRGQGTKNLLWLTTDVHFAAAFSYAPFREHPDFVFHELVSGPLNAGVFTKEEFDDSLGASRLFLYGPLEPTDIRSFAEAKRWFNFGLVETDAAGRLTARIVNGYGQVIYELELAPR